MKLVSSTDPILRCVAKPAASDLYICPSVREMRKLMNELDGLGLAAPQVGLPFRFFVSRIKGIPVAINPQLAGVSPETTSKSEGCLTWPGRTRFKRRHRWVLAEYTDRSGKRWTKILHDLDARIFQHELDHLDGIVLF